MTEPSPIADLVAQFRWLIENSDGVIGLRLDGGMMPWPEVVKLYLPKIVAEAIKPWASLNEQIEDTAP